MRHFSTCRRVLKSVQTIDAVSQFQMPENATVFSLIQPTNKFHVGNYLGTLKLWKKFNDTKPESGRLLYGLADLHALTKVQDPKAFKQARLESVATILAAGIEPAKSVIFSQSAIPEHSELYWILCCHSGMGYLNRMTQWKSKSGVSEKFQESIFSNEEYLQKTNVGIFMYPVLQAADILLYNATHVPVGDDQSQHLELCRYIAKSFNKNYGCEEFKFVMPRTVLSQYKKILSIRDPQKKMSKSDADKNSCIYLTDDADVIRVKIRKAVTDSVSGSINYDPVQRPGIANLMNIVSGLTGKSIAEVEAQIVQLHVADHKQFKDYVTEVVIEALAPIKSEFTRIMSDKSYLEQVMQQGNDRAREIASANMQKIKRSIGYI